MSILAEKGEKKETGLTSPGPLFNSMLRGSSIFRKCIRASNPRGKKRISTSQQLLLVIETISLDGSNFQFVLLDDFLQSAI